MINITIEDGYLVTRIPVQYLTERQVDVHKLVGNIQLSPRQREVFHMLHLPDKEIADKLCISYSAVKRHVGRILKKFSVSSRRDLLQITTKEVA